METATIGVGRATGLGSGVLEDLCDDYCEIVFLLGGSGEVGDGIGDVGCECRGGVGFVVEDDLFEAIEGELFGSIVLLLSDAVGEEGEDVAGLEGECGVGELCVGED